MRGISWRKFLLALVLSVSVVIPATTEAAAAFNWRQFAGESIYGLVFVAPYIDAWMRPLIPEFEKETGIKVRMEALIDTQVRQKQDIILSGKDPSLDFYMLQMDNRGLKLTAAGHLENLEPYLKDPTLTPPGYGYPDDWAGGCLNTERVLAGQTLNNLVFSAQAQVLHIRKDLFEKHKVKVPETLAELEEAAKRLTVDENGDGQPDIYGFISRAQGGLATASFASYLFNHGGSWIKRVDGRRVANINAKESVDAFEYYGRLIRQYAPKAALANRLEDNANLFAAGKVAMLSELNYFIVQFQDPAKSKVVGKVASILIPRGAGGSFPNLPTTSLAISPYSKKKNATWLFLAWMTQKDKMQFGQNNGAPMCRKSVWTDPSYKPPAPEWGESARLALEYGAAIAKPTGVAISQLRDAAGSVINVAIRDGSRAAIQAEADKQAKAMNDLIESTEKGLEITDLFRPGAKRL